MMNPLIVFILAASAALVFSFLCSIFESVLLSVRPAHVEALARKGSRAGRMLRRFKRDIDKPIAAILILNTLAHTIGATLAGANYEKSIGSKETAWLFGLVFAVLILIFTEIIPKTLGVAYVKKLSVPVTYGISVLVVVLRYTGMLFLTTSLTKVLTKGRKERPVTSIEEIRLLAHVGRAEGAVGARVADVIEGVASLSERTVYDVMVPRGGIVYLSAERSVERNLQAIRSCGHSRFPFSPTEDLDDVTGVVLAK